MEQLHGIVVTHSAEVVLNAEQCKKKRGRPKKKFSAGDAIGGSESGLGGQPDEIAFKRRRGRPIGSGSSLSPQIITVRPGQDVMAVIRVFPSQRNRAVCVLAAYGILQSAMLCVPKGAGRGAAKASQFCVQGALQILTFSGAMCPHEMSGPIARGAGGGGGGMDVDCGAKPGENPRMSISLINEEGGLQAGCVAGPLIAGGPVQLVLATFRHGDGSEENNAAANSGAPALLAMQASQPTPPSLQPPPPPQLHQPLLPHGARGLEDVSLAVDQASPSGMAEARHAGGPSHLVRQAAVRMGEGGPSLRGDASGGLYSLFGAPAGADGGMLAPAGADGRGGGAGMLGPALGSHDGSTFVHGDKGGLERLVGRQGGRGDAVGGGSPHALHHQQGAHTPRAQAQVGLERYHPHQYGGGHPRAAPRLHQVSTYDKETYLPHAPQESPPQWRHQSAPPALLAHHHGTLQQLQQQQQHHPSHHLHQQAQQPMPTPQQQLQLQHQSQSEPAFSEKRMQWRNSRS
eukprot:jgi/Mesvir1/12428/Mv00593-RA.2